MHFMHGIMHMQRSLLLITIWVDSSSDAARQGHPFFDTVSCGPMLDDTGRSVSRATKAHKRSGSKGSNNVSKINFSYTNPPPPPKKKITLTIAVICNSEGAAFLPAGPLLQEAHVQVMPAVSPADRSFEVSSFLLAGRRTDAFWMSSSDNAFLAWTAFDARTWFCNKNHKQECISSGGVICTLCILHYITLHC